MHRRRKIAALAGAGAAIIGSFVAIGAARAPGHVTDWGEVATGAAIGLGGVLLVAGIVLLLRKRRSGYR